VAVEKNLALRGIVESCHQARNGRLATAR
jgi:hypothetical protein